MKDHLFSDRVAALARPRGFAVIEVDGSRSPAPIFEQVESLFAEPLSRNRPTDLAAVRRWENENVLGNVRAWIGTGEHPSAAGLAFQLACECGRSGCSGQVSLTLREVEDPRQPVLAPGRRH